MFFKNYKLHFKIFLFFIFFLLIEGFFYYYSYKLSYFFDFFDPRLSGFNPIIWNENGLIENIQVLFLLFTITVYYKTIKLLNKKNLPKLFNFIIYIYLLCICYYFFEEISWGQHIFKWESGDFFIIYNNQEETNFHNISNLFNQLPRALLTIWCCFSFLLFRYLNNTSIDTNYLNLIFPKKELIYISIIIILFFLPDFIIDKLSLHPGYRNYSANINISEILDFVSFRYIKLSELHEFLFCIYLFYHSLFFKKIYSS